MAEPINPLVRKAQVTDAESIAAIDVRSWQSGYRGLVPDALLEGLSVNQRAASWRQWLRQPPQRGFTLLAELDGVAVGFGSTATPARDADSAPNAAEVSALYVDPPNWRRGVGSALLSAILEELRRAGWAQVTLWVFENNPAARGLYRAFGFAPDGTTKLEPERPQQIRLRVSLLC